MQQVTPATVPRVVRIRDSEFYSGSGEQIDERITRMCAWLEQNSCGFYRVTRSDYLVTVAFYDREEAAKFSRRCETNLSFAIPFDDPIRVELSRAGLRRDASWVDGIDRWTEDECTGRYLIVSHHNMHLQAWLSTGYFECDTDAVAFSLRWA